MFIESILIKNDVRFKAGLNTNELFIELNNKNKLNLICGDNGTGKTSLLSVLSPLAEEVIELGKEGSKKIVFKKKKSRIEVEHIYIPKKVNGRDTHTVKHYIRKIKGKNSVELNENGNESTFLAAVEEELGVRPEQMKLIQLGNDMTNIIKMQPALRKSYISKFIDDIEKYLKKGKVVNEKLRAVNDLLNNYSKALGKLGNKDQIKDRLFNIKSELLSLNNTKEKLIKNIAINDQIIDKFNNSNDKDYYDKYQIINDKNISDEIRSMKYSDIIEKISELERCILSNENQLNINEIKEENIDDKIKNLNKQISEIKLALSVMTNVEIEENYEERLKELKEMKYDNIPFSESLDEDILKLESGIDITISKIKDINKKIDVMLCDIESDYIDYFLCKLTPFEANNTMIDLKNKILENQNKLIFTAAQLKNTELELKNCVEPPKEVCFTICPLLKNKKSKSELEKNIKSITESFNKLKNNDEELNKLQEKYKKCFDIMIMVKEMSDFIIENKNIIKLVFPDMFLIPDVDNYNYNVLIQNIKNHRYIIEESYIDLFLNILNCVKMRKNNKKEIEIIESKIKIDNEYNEKKTKCDKLNEEYEILLLDKQKFITTNKEIKFTINQLEEKRNSLLNFKNLLKDLDNIELIKEKANKYIKDLEEYNKANEILQSDIEALEITNKNIEKYDNEKENLSSRLKEITRIEKTKIILESYHQDCKMVKNSLSTNEGIPTIKIDSFMQSIRFLANEILEDCFESDTFKFDTFVINSKEFRLPVTFNNTSIDDISKCSSGQRALGMLALSLSLYEKTGCKFNIIGLDELDGPLDEHKRRSFLRTCLDRFDELGIDQIFNITHNKAFNDVDANFILFKGSELDSVNNQKNIIFKIE